MPQNKNNPKRDTKPHVLRFKEIMRKKQQHGFTIEVKTIFDATPLPNR